MTLRVSLSEFIENSQDKREVQRAIAVKMLLEGYTHVAIQSILGVSSGFISKWKKAFFTSGVEGLKLGYKGSQGFLNPQQRAAVIEWLKIKDKWNLSELEYEIASKYGVVFESKQSYYDLFDVARISWKKTQAHNPKHDEELVASKKKELCGLLEARRSEIESGRLVVFMVDECHLLWGDVFGYVWAAAFGGKLPPETCLGKTSERVSVPVVNARCKQTYFGGLDYKTLIVLNLPRQDCKFTRLQLVSWNTFNPNVLEQNC